MTTAIAQRKIDTFKKRYDQSAFELACYASLPVVVDSEFVNLLRVNFLLGLDPSIPYTIESDVLQNLCQGIGDGFYEFERDVRDLLLQSLLTMHESERVREVATLLWQYTIHADAWIERDGLTAAQQLTALNFLNSAKAQEWLREAEESEISGQQANARWIVSMQREIDRYNPDVEFPVATEEIRAKPEPPFHINFPQNQRFQGRETELAALHQLLQTNSSTGVTSALIGVGGIGKTQLAVEYAYRHRSDYPGGIFLINAAGNVQSQLLDAAKLLNLKIAAPERDDINDQLLTQSHAYLETNPKTLLIFDDVDDPEQLLRTRLGRDLTLADLGGTKLFVSRTQELPEQMSVLSVDTLENDPASAKAIITNARPDLAADPQLEELCRRLEYLPLALNMCASLLKEQTDLSIADYIDRLGKTTGLEQFQPTKQQLEQLINALLGAFDVHGLARFVRWHFDQDIEWIVPVPLSEHPPVTIASDLVLYFASQEGGLKKLLQGAIEMNPSDKGLLMLGLEWLKLEFAPLSKREERSTQNAPILQNTTRQQIDQLINALLHAFNFAELSRFTHLQFGTPLEQFVPVAGQRNLTNIISELVVYFAGQENGLKQLLDAALRANPLNEGLRILGAEWSVTDPTPLPLPKEHPSADHAEYSSAPTSGSDETNRLTKINGIGQGYQKRLNKAGIYTFVQLATTDPSRIHEICKIKERQVLDIASWIKQAEELALSEVQKSGGRQSEIKYLSDQGNTYQAKGELDKAIGSYEQALAIASEIGDKQGEGSSLNNLASVYQAKGELDKAIGFYEQAQQTNEQVGDTRGLTNTFSHLGNIYQSTGELDKAITYYEQALAIVRELGDRQDQGNLLGNLGNVHALLGDVMKAINCYEQALVVARELSNRSGERHLFSNLGNVHTMLGDVETALNCYEQALKISREIGDINGISISLSEMADVYVTRGDLDQALDLYNQSLDIKDKLGDIKGRSATLSAVANIRMAQNRWSDAEKLLNESLTLSKTLGDIREIAFSTVKLGQVAQSQSDLDTARQRYIEGLQAFEQLGMPEANQVRQMLASLDGDGQNEAAQSLTPAQLLIAITQTAEQNAGQEEATAQLSAAVEEVLQNGDLADEQQTYLTALVSLLSEPSASAAGTVVEAGQALGNSDSEFAMALFPHLARLLNRVEQPASAVTVLAEVITHHRKRVEAESENQAAAEALSVMLYNHSGYLANANRLDDAVAALEEGVAIDERYQLEDLASDQQALIEMQRRRDGLPPLAEPSSEDAPNLSNKKTQIQIQCHTCQHKWTMTYKQLKEEGELVTYRDETTVEEKEEGELVTYHGETTVEEYAVKCPLDGVRNVVTLTITEEDE